MSYWPPPIMKPIFSPTPTSALSIWNWRGFA
jgi:hypothetical protein